MKMALSLLGVVLVLLGGIFYSKSTNDNPTFTHTPSVLVDLHSQGLTKLPESVLKNTKVEELDLSHNKLTGSLPAEIRQLPSLRVLELNDNEFTGVPAEIGQLSNLEILDLSNNQLTGLPHELGNLQKLRLLDISGNNYSEQDVSIIRSQLPSSTVIRQ